MSIFKTATVNFLLYPPTVHPLPTPSLPPLSSYLLVAVAVPPVVVLVAVVLLWCGCVVFLQKSFLFLVLKLLEWIKPSMAFKLVLFSKPTHSLPSLSLPASCFWREVVGYRFYLWRDDENVCALTFLS